MDGNLERPIKKMLDITPGKGAKAKALSKKMGKKDMASWRKEVISVHGGKDFKRKGNLKQDAHRALQNM